MTYTANGLTITVSDEDEIPIETRSFENGSRVVTVTMRKVKTLSRAEVFYYLQKLHASKSRSAA